MTKDKEELTITRNIQEAVIDNPRSMTKGKIIWINVVNAGKKELEYLRKRYGFQLSHLQLASSNVFVQRPAIHHGPDYIFAILHFPIFTNGTIAATEVDFFFAHGYLVTLHNGNIPALNEFFNLCKKDGGSLLSFKLESTSILLYELLEKLMHGCYPLLDASSIEITRVQEMIFQQDPKKAVSEILTLRHNVANFHKIMHSHKKIITKIMELKSTILPGKEIELHYKKLIDQTITIWEILENQKETIEILNSTNESLLNYRLSEIMKLMTILSIISLNVSLVGVIFTIPAVGVPFIHQNYGFWMVIGIMAVVGLSIFLLFRRKKWL